MATRFLKEHVGPDTGIARRDARHVAKATGRELQQHGVLFGDATRLVHQGSGEQVRYVTRDRYETIVVVGADRNHVRAELTQHAMQGAIGLGRSGVRGRQHPRATLEQVRACPRGAP